MPSHNLFLHAPLQSNYLCVCHSHVSVAVVPLHTMKPIIGESSESITPLRAWKPTARSWDSTNMSQLFLALKKNKIVNQLECIHIFKSKQSDSQRPTDNIHMLFTAACLCVYNINERHSIPLSVHSIIRTEDRFMTCKKHVSHMSQS